MLNILFSILPLLAITLVVLYNSFIINDIETIISILSMITFIGSIVFAFYISLNLVFNFSITKSSLFLKNYRLSLRYGRILAEPVKKMREILKLKDVKVKISSNTEIKSYTVSSLTKHIICLTTGLLDALKLRTRDDAEFQKAVFAILVKEGIRIKKGHYFTNEILYLENLVTNQANLIVSYIFIIVCKILSIVPIFGRPMAQVISFLNIIIQYILHIPNKILMVIYKLIEVTSGEKSEYELEKTTAQIVGGENIALAMSLTKEAKLGMFSWPGGIERKIAKIKQIEISKEKINTGGGGIKIIITIILIFCMILFFGLETKSWKIVDFYKSDFIKENKNLNKNINEHRNIVQ